MANKRDKGIGDRFKEICEKLDSIERRLFRDNGTLSVQTRLDRHEQVIRGLIWALSVVGGSLLTTFVAVAVLAVRAFLGG
ncbi:MAG: hypothetical protein JJU29_18460 [Verrucomicrobia bacterium]|nr:hypothetical protein [Verrucomicrobiota bacterium]MCH8512332.1 hypothetical protein [Kiritimatiellia bacterium]